jgi:hypothetical protein
MCNRAREDGSGMRDNLNMISVGQRDGGDGSKGRGDGRVGGSEIVGVVRWLFVELEQQRRGVQRSLAAQILRLGGNKSSKRCLWEGLGVEGRFSKVTDQILCLLDGS